MIDGPAQNRFGEIANKWRALVEKRRDDFVELHMSGRWTTYFTEPEFKRRMQDVAGSVELWAKVAPQPPVSAAPRAGAPRSVTPKR